MDNERYLVVSYFAAAGIGVALALATALVLGGPIRRALAAAAPLAQLLRRALPPWLVLAALLGFLSVTYFDCQHKTYQDIVAGRLYLVDKTFEQGSQMAVYLAAALVAYGLVLGICLAVQARKAGASSSAK
jgi:hypothetical protein